MSPTAWLESEGRSVVGLAAEIKAQPSTIYRMLAGERYPSFAVLILFHELSAGEVALSDWVAIFRERKGKLPASRMAAAPLRRLLKPKTEAQDARGSKGGRRRQGRSSESV